MGRDGAIYLLQALSNKRRPCGANQGRAALAQEHQSVRRQPGGARLLPRNTNPCGANQGARGSCPGTPIRAAPTGGRAALAMEHKGILNQIQGDLELGREGALPEGCGHQCAIYSHTDSRAETFESSVAMGTKMYACRYPTHPAHNTPDAWKGGWSAPPTRRA